MNGPHIDDEALAGLAMVPPEDPERTASRTHLAECASCRERLAAVEATLAVLDAGPFEPPADLVARGEATLRAASEDRVRSRWGAPVLLLALLGAVGVVLLRFAGLEAVLGDGTAFPALKCALFELGGGALGTGAAVALSRRAGRGLPPTIAGAGAALGALGAEIYLHLRCPAHEALHLWLAHAGCVVIAAALAAALAALAGPRVSPRRG